jgi:hypothetical protein
MTEFFFRAEDIQQFKRRGVTEERIISQIEMFKQGAPFLRINRPCTIGDGIRKTTGDESNELTSMYEEYGLEKVLTKFVPASGAATRMFKTLLRFNSEQEQIQLNSSIAKAHQGDKDIQQLVTFIEGIEEFAFLDDLKPVMAENGLDTDALLARGHLKEIIDYLLTKKGLEYAQLPKGLLKFHKYPQGSRTPFEEHLVEAASYVRDEHGKCRLHFTVSPEHKDRFEALLEAVRKRYEEDLGARFEVDFSVQAKSTDTIAVDGENKPFRLDNGTILFRPGGHGALIENLNSIKGDMIYIKNIDNVVPDRLKDETNRWKKILGGYLIRTQQHIFSYLKSLSSDSVHEELLSQAFDFAKNELSIAPAEDLQWASAGEKRDFLISKFNRPVRVCGMVKNEGEPGGGPFWVEAKDGSLSLQIVESAQIDPESEEQQSILQSSTHFNPVDIVCGVRDWQGNPFDVKRFVDPEAVFISKKSKQGRDLKALELPGLWNGAMADWNTIFVEVPLITFNPVKTINDLLRKEHCQER